MIIKILGAAAGGGFPQWNCNGANSAKVRTKTPGFQARTQSSLAISSDGKNWVLLNASPDLREQLNNTPELWPFSDGGLRNSPIKAVVLTNGDVDHIAGLINLREGHPFHVYGSDRVLATLSANSIFNVMNPEIVPRRTLPLDDEINVQSPEGDVGLSIKAFAVPGKVALYLEDENQGPDFGTKEGDTIGLEITATDSGKKFYYVPGCAEVDEKLAARLKNAPLVLFDGTLFTDSEMLDQGLSHKTGKRMGHISISGPDGSIAAFEPLDVDRKVYIHINNSNPVLDDNSPERNHTEAAGWEIGFDGMEIKL